MGKIKFLLPVLALVLLVIIGCEKGNQPLSPADQANEPGALAKGGGHRTGQILFAVTTSNRLLKFSSDDPDESISRRRITGLQRRERILGIDFRPATGALYALGSSSRLYVIDASTGAATPVGGPFSTALNGSAFGFDFNPTVDRIRVVSNTGQNLRLNPNDGAVAAVDAALAYATTDPNAGRTPSIAGAAYTNPDNNPATGTTLYDLDTDLDVLVIQNPPNNGTLNTVGSLGRNAKRLLGFDIAPSGIAYAAWAEGDDDDDDDNRLVRIDLATGRATKLGEIDGAIVGLAAPAP